MNKFFIPILVCILQPVIAQAMSTSFSEVVTYSNASKLFDQKSFESLVAKVSNESNVYFHEFREFLLPESKMVAQFFCDSFLVIKTEEEIAKEEQKQLNDFLNPYDGQLFFRKLFGMKVLATAEYKEVTPRYFSMFKVPVNANTQCNLRLTWSKKDPTIRAHWSHWHAGWGDTEKHPFNRTRKEMNAFLSRALTEITKKPVTSQSDKDTPPQATATIQ